MGDVLKNFLTSQGPTVGPEGVVQPGRQAGINPYLPMLAGLSGALSTPSRGGAGPIIGAGLGGYAQGEMMQEQAAQQLAAKQATAQAQIAWHKAQQENWERQLKQRELQHEETLKRLEASQAAREKGAELGYKGRIEAAQISASARGARGAGSADKEADRKRKAFGLGATKFDNAYRQANVVPGMNKADKSKLDWANTPEGRQALAESAEVAGMSEEEFVQKMHLASPTRGPTATATPSAEAQALLDDVIGKVSPVPAHAGPTSTRPPNAPKYGGVSGSWTDEPAAAPSAAPQAAAPTPATVTAPALQPVPLSALNEISRAQLAQAPDGTVITLRGTTYMKQGDVLVPAPQFNQAPTMGPPTPDPFGSVYGSGYGQIAPPR